MQNAIRIETSKRFVGILTQLLSGNSDNSKILNAIENVDILGFPTWDEYVFGYENKEREIGIFQFDADWGNEFKNGYGFESIFKLPDEMREIPLLNVVIGDSFVSMVLAALIFQDWIVFNSTVEQIESKFEMFSSC